MLRDLWRDVHAESGEKHLSALSGTVNLSERVEETGEIQCTSLKHLLYALSLFFLLSLLHSKINFSNLF
jgi:hypothetical protein